MSHFTTKIGCCVDHWLLLLMLLLLVLLLLLWSLLLVTVKLQRTFIPNCY
jgi:hypothetical protein